MNRSLDRGLLTLEAGRPTLRLLPPLVISGEQIDRAATIIEECVEVEETERFPR
jgi:acetylornithine/N-succinyldiaminopimelate aminotransferase